MHSPDKSTLRAQLRQIRSGLDAADRDRLARGAADLVGELPGWRLARRVAVYMAADGEMDPGPIAARARAEGKQLYLPVIQPDQSLRFAPWAEGETLRPNRYGIPEPAATGGDATTLDIVFLPLVGWDRRGVRLGMGGGYYDRSLQAAPGPLRVGLGFGAQEIESLPREDWDIALQFVITGESLIRTGEGD